MDSPVVTASPDTTSMTAPLSLRTARQLANLRAALDDNARSRETSLRCGRNALLADRQSDDGRAAILDDGQDA